MRRFKQAWERAPPPVVSRRNPVCDVQNSSACPSDSLRWNRRRTVQGFSGTLRSLPGFRCRYILLGPGGLRESECKKPLFCKGFLVGAAGFEPTTCSTQNCRATRLRYTPFSPWSIHARGVRSKVSPRALRGRRSRHRAAGPSATIPRSPSRGGSRPPSCLWTQAQSALAHTGRGAARSCRSGAGFPCARRYPACPRPW
jgi:hypothetical protein